MKRIKFAISLILVIFVIGPGIFMGISSCTEQSRSRSFGGDSTIKLQPGEKLIMATFKDDNIWYLVEPMEADYVPKTKVLKESSSWGVLEGSVTFIERK